MPHAGAVPTALPQGQRWTFKNYNTRRPMPLPSKLYARECAARGAGAQRTSQMPDRSNTAAVTACPAAAAKCSGARALAPAVADGCAPHCSSTSTAMATPLAAKYIMINRQ
jgi:hypothetical protein